MRSARKLLDRVALVAIALLAGFGANAFGDGVSRPVAAAPLAPYFIQGVLGSYSTATVCSFTAGSWKDSTNTVDVANFPATTADLTIVGAGGLDQTVISETGSSSSPTITASASIYHNFNSAVLAGTAGSNGTVVFGSSTTDFTAIAVNDVVRIGSFGSARVASVDTPHTLTLKAALTGGNATAGSTVTVYYQPTIWIGSTATDKRFVNTINDAGTSIVVDVVPGALGTVGAGAALTIGVVPNLTSESTINVWFYPWARLGTTGTTVAWSTQRVTPYTIAGYTTAVRRVGAFPIVGGNATATLAHLNQREASSFTRDTLYFCNYSADNTRALSNGSVQGTLTRFVANNAIPPTSRLGFLNLASTAGSGNNQMGVCENPVGIQSGSGNTAVVPVTWLALQGSVMANAMPIGCDGSQAYQYITNAASGAYVDVFGFRDDLTK